MQGFGEIRQIGYLTDNIEQAMQSWMEKSSVGPFTHYKNLTLPFCYKGVISEVEMDVGIAFRGDMQIELIQQTNDAPSVYQAFYQRNQMGLHHLAYITQDMDSSLAMAEKKGFDIVATLDAAIGRFAYFQDPTMPEVFYEFLEVPQSLESFWQDSIAAAKNWDGSINVQTIDMKNI